MDINIFIERRKSLKISQVKLCKGICTQSTLSKFENNGRVPSLSILSKLCARLGLSVDDLYRNALASTTHMRNVLNRIESELMMQRYSDVGNSLDEIKVGEIKSDSQEMQYFYEKGLYNALTNGKTEDTFYYFAQILDNLDENHRTIYSYLAYVGLGIVYSRTDQKKQADFYFTKVFDYIERHKDENFDKGSINAYLRILTIVFFTADFYLENEKYDLSTQLVYLGIKLCSEQHITYYLPRLKLLSAQNAIAQKKPKEKILSLLADASAFARINHNEIVGLKVKALQGKYQNESND